jgi:hypothetical protein
VTCAPRAVLPLLVALLAFGSEPRAVSDALDVPSYTVDTGGEHSGGGGFSVVGSIGQLDADPLHPARGGRYTLIGGFIPGAVTSGSQGDVLFADGFEE